MLRAAALVLLVAVGLAAAVHPQIGVKSGVGSSNAFPPVWPIPAMFTNGTGIAVIDATSLVYQAAGAKSPQLDKAWARFMLRTFPHSTTAPPSNANPITVVQINVKDVTAPLQLYVDESYTLTVTQTQILINAPTLFGAYHALETLSQLIGFDFDLVRYDVHHVPWNVRDAPRFPHRGLLIDSSRHFLPITTIKQVIDSVTYAKFNTIHWHIVDAISFPFDSPTYPQLGRMGSYSPQERYTTADVADVVSYALDRGVRVEVELDTPGHSASMCAGMPEICPNPLCTSANVNNWALDITRNETYTVINGLLGDLVALFPENLIHLGGDEVDPDCWAAHPYIMQWLADRGLTLDGGYEYYVDRVQKMAWALNREVVGWQEIWDHFGTSLNPRTIIQQWLPNSIALPLNVTSHGYRLIWSDSSVWYLDHLAVTWQQMYVAEPCNGLPDKNCGLILGGEACQWGETVDTSDIMQTVWPRAAAVAERLWSPRSNNATTTAVHDRLRSFRCLLNQRGVAAAPVDNLFARDAPSGPGSCYRQ